jgi:hypothetical protein
MRRPVKRKGYASGGFVDPVGDQLADTYNRSSKDTEATARWGAARQAQASAEYNQMSPQAQRSYRSALESAGRAPGKLYSGRDVDLARADYPGFKKGGKVTKVIKRKR